MATPEQTADQVRQCLRRGDFLTAFDLADRALSSGQPPSDLAYLAILSLARSGATEQAIEYLQSHESALPRTEDVAALRARLIKDQRKATTDPDLRGSYGAMARDAYLAAFREFHGFFSGINAATLSLVIGDGPTARHLAAEALDLARPGADTDYWRAATCAEACLLLGRLDETAIHLGRARELAGNDFAARGTTYRQLRLLLERLGVALPALEALRPPAVLHFVGPVAGAAAEPASADVTERALRNAVRSLLATEDAGFAFGALLGWPDLIVAEELLSAGLLLHLVQPVSLPELTAQPIWMPARIWTARLEAVLARATSVMQVAQETRGDALLLARTASLRAAGLARLKAETLDARAVQYRVSFPRDVWPAGVKRPWMPVGSCGFPLRRLPLAGEVCLLPPRAAAVTPRDGLAPQRRLKSMIFADVRGFSRLAETMTLRFAGEWLNFLAALRRRHAGQIAHIATWGDAAYVVAHTAEAAAEIALALAEAPVLRMAFDPGAGAPPALGVRVSAHVGAVFRVPDPVAGRRSFYGPDVTKTARMEPRTPPGLVYVSEEFAAHLTLEAPSRYRCEYAGEQELAKGYGPLRMYHLARRPAAAVVET